MPSRDLRTFAALAVATAGLAATELSDRPARDSLPSQPCRTFAH